MLKKTYWSAAANVFHSAPSTYPFLRPFHDTPYDQNRGRHDKLSSVNREESWPKWMDEGSDGIGTGIGLHRTHPLSKLQGNLHRGSRQVPRVITMMIQGVWHKSGNKLYFRGGKPPNPSKHPYLTGEPCPIYGWKITDPIVIRQFNVPALDKDKNLFKPYVALHERKLVENALTSSTASQARNTDQSSSSLLPPKPTSSPQTKPLIKRLFFWE